MTTLKEVRVKELKPLKLKVEGDMDDLEGKCPSGLFGMYYHLSPRRGVKIIRNNEGSSWLSSGDANIEKLKRLVSWRLAKQEAELIAEAHQKTNGRYVPKCYGYLPVKVGGIWYSAIKIQHVAGIELYKMGWDFDRQARYLEDCEERLREYDVHQEDVHSSNVIVRVKGDRIISWKMVDFSPDRSSSPW